MIEAARKKEEQILEQARKKSEEIVLKGEEKALKIEENAEREAQKNLEKLEKLEERIIQKEEKLDEKKEQLESEKAKIADRFKEAETFIIQQEEKLTQIANLSKDDAKQELLNMIQMREEQEISSFLEKFRVIKKEEADKEAMQIVARVMPRIAADSVGEYTSELIDIPDESFKGKLIGREGRNINYWEKITGVELVIDDTPGVVRISCTEHEKRFVASTTLKRLLKDGRINPFYIEKFHTEAVNGFDEIVLEKGKEALNLLNIPMMNPEIVQLIGKFFFRYSYGQNLRHHSIEVARIAE